MKKKFSSQTFLRFSLIFVLIGSLRHVAWSFSTLENSGEWSLVAGYFQAIAIDLVVIALAYGIEQRKKASLPTGWYWGGLVGFVLVSTYSNLLYGLVFSANVQQSRDWPVLSLWMIYLKPFVLSGVLPIMLVYISHITAGSQASDVPVDRPELKRAWAVSIIAQWQERRGRIPTPAELVSSFRAETGQALTVQEAVALLSSGMDQTSQSKPAELPQIEPSSEPSSEPVEPSNQAVSEHDIEHATVAFYRNNLKLSWVEIAKRTGKSKTTLLKYYKNGTVK